MLTNFVSLIALPFDVWRISSILVHEAGPFDIMDKLRYFIGIRYNSASEAYGTNTIAELFLCIWCMSVWVSALLVIIMLVLPTIGTIINIIFAASAMAILLEKIING